MNMHGEEIEVYKIEIFIIISVQKLHSLDSLLRVNWKGL